MILSALTGGSLVLLASFGPVTSTGAGAHMSAARKQAVVQPSVSRATECVARGVSADPRFKGSGASKDLADLIVESVLSCAELMRAMIENYDAIYGDGTGEAFFSGPYLDLLPTAVSKLVKEAGP
jgi:hypothetical protein